MKLILAVIRPSALNAVRAALTALGIGGLSVAEASVMGDLFTGNGLMNPAIVCHDDPQANMKLEIAVVDEDVDRAVEAIAGVVHGETMEDGKIFVVSLSQARRIRTGEANDEAL